MPGLGPMTCARTWSSMGQNGGRRQRCWQTKGKQKRRACLGLKVESGFLSPGYIGNGGSGERGFYHLGSIDHLGLRRTLRPASCVPMLLYSAQVWMEKGCCQAKPGWNCFMDIGEESVLWI